MEVSRNSNTPIYRQVKEIILNRIQSGEWKQGDFIPTETELCQEFQISRFPLRQAMDELSAEGILQRQRGKGTIVEAVRPIRNAGKSKVIGIIMTNLTEGVNGNILTGFEREAQLKDYLIMAGCSGDSKERENALIDKMLEQKVAGIVLFSCKDSDILKKQEDIRNAGITLVLIDRNPGLTDVDYVGSDNMGGTYMAVHHLALQGFERVMFVSDAMGISSVKERLEGYQRAVADYHLESLECICEDKYLMKKPKGERELLLKNLNEALIKHRSQGTIGIFCINDYVAMRCIELLHDMGMEIGKDAAVIGYDNAPESGFFKIPLTTVEQNGFLVGQGAAEVVISKLEGKSKQIYYMKIPAQLVIRESCGEV